MHGLLVLVLEDFQVGWSWPGLIWLGLDDKKSPDQGRCTTPTTGTGTMNQEPSFGKKNEDGWVGKEL
jgi:hypothetical protein